MDVWILEGPSLDMMTLGGEPHNRRWFVVGVFSSPEVARRWVADHFPRYFAGPITLDWQPNPAFPETDLVVHVLEMPGLEWSLSYEQVDVPLGTRIR